MVAAIADTCMSHAATQYQQVQPNTIMSIQQLHIAWHLQDCPVLAVNGSILDHAMMRM